jgi:hypothetical protein
MRRTLLLVAGLCAAACRPDPASVENPEPAERQPEPTPIAPERCGPAGERLHGLDWIPTDAGLVALVDLDAPDLEESLANIAALAREEAHGLPMDVAFGLAHWDFQVPLVATTLRRAGFEPAELAVVRLGDVGTSWVFASSCDFETATQRARSSWGVRVRRTASGAIGSPEGEQAFPFDVVFLPGDRVALTPAQRGADFMRMLAMPSTSEGLRPGTLLETLEPAPIRAIVRGPALTAPGTTEPPITQRLRASGSGVEIDGRLAPTS